MDRKPTTQRQPIDIKEGPMLEYLQKLWKERERLEEQARLEELNRKSLWKSFKTFLGL
jgi:hypothetical protein